MSSYNNGSVREDNVAEVNKEQHNQYWEIDNGFFLMLGEELHDGVGGL